MTKRMLIDSTHPEETRVAIVSGNRLEEYDFETTVRRQLKSNIYLVKVTRVEPSLQAAFVDFGGNRHGFLPFPEIHPDYYRIPIADREALLAEERALAAAQAAKEDAEDEAELAQLAKKGESAEDGEESDDEDLIDIDDEEETALDSDADEDEDAPYVPQHTGSLAADITEASVVADDADMADDSEEDDSEDAEEGDDAAEHEHSHDGEAAQAEGESSEAPVFRSSIKRRYKIQEVIKRNQIMLIQISKEERGNKGAAVTSYISLPGRYCVLMPNSPRGGGVSRKVSNAKDRQRLKAILRELNVPEGMSVILRTAGVARSTAEIKRDLDYLLRLWDQIRELTLRSTAPALIYEEGNLIKRAIRDLYRRDIDEVHVAGEEGFTAARDFMNTLMPSHVERVHAYKEEHMPLFTRYQVESQIDAIHSPTVHLKSGGYIVINPTEALVSIDVNSGRATKGRHIEETALKTNIEAAEEIARQVRLRDQGGLVVIDFIDMEDRRSNRTVEKKLRDAMASDRARIQIGRISAFGLMELSRQRLHPSLVETNFETCKHCAGLGLVRTIETTAVIILRAIEEEAMKSRSSEFKVSVPTDIALYIFNHKRDMLASIERRYNVKVFLSADDSLIKPAYNIEQIRANPAERQNRQRNAPVKVVDMSDMPALSEDDITSDSTVSEDERFDNITQEAGEDDDQGSRRESRDRGGRGRDRNGGGDRNSRQRGGRNRQRGGRDRNDRNAQPRNPQAAEGVMPIDAEQPHVNAAPFSEDAANGHFTEAQQPRRNSEPQNAGEGGEGGEDDRGNRRRRGRRGGRNRRSRTDRPVREGGSQAADGGESGGQAPAFRASQDNAPAPEGLRSQRQESASGSNASPARQNNDHGGDSSGGNESTDSDGNPRKGWWKRLTE